MDASGPRTLPDHPLFERLNPQALELLTAHLHRQQYRPGQLVFREGDPDDGLYLVQTGCFSVRQRTDWGERELCTIKAGELFGEMESLSPSHRVATIVARDSSECLRIDPEGITWLIANEPVFTLNISRELVHRIREQDSIVSAELYKSYRALTYALANLTDSRDPETGSHLARTRTYCAILADRLKQRGLFRETISTDFVENIYNLSPLHDIGKVSVPDSILRKPGPLTDQEFEIMKQHTVAGAHAFDQALVESDNYLFRMGRQICLYHHERWDGSGYPEGLRGPAIPVEARIMALADVYDALLSKRVYKESFNYERARAEIRLAAGRFFDPDIAAVMLDCIKDFERINEQYLEPEES